MAILLEIPKDLEILESIFKSPIIAKNISNYFLDSATLPRILSLDCGNSRIEKSVDLDNKITAIEQSYMLKNSGTFEAHRKFVDFQFVLKGSEIMKIGFANAFSAINEYNATKDVQNFTPFLTPSSIALYENALLILTPHDIHAGGFTLDSKVVFKSVLKVPTSLLKIVL